MAALLWDRDWWGWRANWFSIGDGGCRASELLMCINVFFQPFEVDPLLCFFICCLIVIVTWFTLIFFGWMCYIPGEPNIVVFWLKRKNNCNLIHGWFFHNCNFFWVNVLHTSRAKRCNFFLGECVTYLQSQNLLFSG